MRKKREGKMYGIIDNSGTRTHLNFTQKHDTADSTKVFSQVFTNHFTFHSSEAFDATLHIHKCKYKQKVTFFL